LTKSAQQTNYNFKILEAVLVVNEAQKIHLLPKITAYFKDGLKGKKIALWGLAFKPNTDDIREAPALKLIEELTAKGAIVTAYDPEAMENVKREIKDKINYAENQYHALKDADALIIATEWSEFRTPDFIKIKSLLKTPVIFDGRNLFELSQMEERGFHYVSIGRKAVEIK